VTPGREPAPDRAREQDRERDRDPAGRPRNARARDGLGRPLPRSAQPAADAQHVPQVPDTLGPAEAVRLADELLRAGHPFHAHEALEAAWKTGPAAERDLWQGLAQIAVGLTHAHRGNAKGAVTLLRRGAKRVSDYHGDRHGIDLDTFRAAAQTLADTIEQHGLAAIPAADLRPALS
jgi:uncharacterized protein